MQLEIATGFYQSDSLPLAAQRCINWIPVIMESGALNKRALFDVLGIKSLSLTGDAIVGQNRGAQQMAGVPYFVNGQNFYSIDANNVVTDHGSIPGISRVSIANNGQYMVIVVPGDKAFAFNNQDSTLTQITDLDFEANVSDTVSFKDGYFIFTATDGSIFFNSALNDPLTYDALDFGSADVRPDKIVGTHVNHNELFVLGEETIELFQNIGGSGFPFQRVPGGDIQKGVYGPVIDFDNSFVFVGGAVNELASIWRVGGGVTKISTAAIDTAIQKFTKEEIRDSYAMTWAHRGNFFVSFTFSSDRIPGKTFVYDATTSALSGESTWHERQTGVADAKWRVTSIVSAYGKLLVGDSVDGRIGEMDKDTFDEYGEIIFRQKVSMPFASDQLPIFAGELKLVMEAGQGTIAGRDPQIKMDYSDDGAQTFSNGWFRSYGKIGDYPSYPSWRRLGRIPRNRVLRFTTSERVKSVMIRLDASAEQGVQI